MHDQLRGFTRGIPEAVEQTPAFEAMFSEERVIPTTWGHLASQLVEADLVDPTAAAVCDFLNITQRV